MFSIDDRVGNVMISEVVLLIAATIRYRARVAFFILLLSPLFAYLLVILVQQRSRLGRKIRSWAIAQVYLIGLVVLGGVSG